MDYTENHGRARAPISRLSSGHTYYTLESLQGVTTLPPSLPSSAFVPIPMGGRAMPPTLYPVSSIGTDDLRDTMVRDPYRQVQPITDREPTLNIKNYRDSIGHLQSLNWSVDPTHNTQQYQHHEFVNRPLPPPQIYQHQSRQQQVFKSRLSKNLDFGLQRPKSKNRVHREIPAGIKDMDAQTPKIPGWCSLCDVTCSTKEVLHKDHVFGKKHQSTLKKLKEKGSEDGAKPQKKQPQGLIGWCSLCEVNCGSLENLHEKHISGKKHLSMLGMPKTKEQETAETSKDNVRAHREIPAGIKDMDAQTPKIPGWCSLCDVTCSTKEVLHKDHVFGKKHQSMLKKLKEKEKGSEDGAKPQKKQPQGLIGWCSLCEVNCGSLENLHEKHMSGKNHLSMLGMPKTKEQETAETGKDNVLGKRKEDSVKEEGHMASKKRQKLHKGNAAHAQVTEDGNSEAHLPVDGETENVPDGKVEEEAFVKAQVEGAD